MSQTFDNILLLGRPASGKSEFIDYMKTIGESERAAKYHIASFKELDDFPWLWQKFMEDNVWEAAGYPRRWSTGGSNPGLSKEGTPLFDFCIEKFNREYDKEYKGNETFFENNTLFIEFARGSTSGYERSLSRLSPDILKRSVILFVLVSFEESLRRNEARYQEKLQHSILAHKVTDDCMINHYSSHDWLTLTGNQPEGRLTVQGLEIPFVTMNNEPELTDPKALDERYRPALGRLWKLKETA